MRPDGVRGAPTMVVRALEFYSGVGGLRYALEAMEDREGEVVAAFDINDMANDVYQHNFGDRPQQRNIAALTASELDEWKADLWMMSPPCQPYTRNGLKKDVEDGRAESFLELLVQLERMAHPPVSILVENVVGFETSRTREKLLHMLESEGYAIEEYILSPIDLGIPYTRPRYFLLASKCGKFRARCSDCTSEVRMKPPRGWETAVENHFAPRLRCMHSWERTCRLALKEFLQSEEELQGNDASPKVEATEGVHDPWESYLVPDKVLHAHWRVLDVVSPHFTRCTCFTKSYSRYAKGTGSIIVQAGTLQNAEEPQKFGTFWIAKQGEFHGIKVASSEALMTLKPRYFTAREIANLHCFPDSFSFPPYITLKQQYALLGNSLNSAVVATLLGQLLPL